MGPLQNLDHFGSTYFGDLGLNPDDIIYTVKVNHKDTSRKSQGCCSVPMIVELEQVSEGLSESPQVKQTLQ